MDDLKKMPALQTTSLMDASVTDLAMFLVKLVISAIPAAALVFMLYILFVLAVVTSSGLIR